MADRTLSVKLLADIQGYVGGMDEVSRKTRETTQTVQQQVGEQRRQYEQLAVAAIAVGGAITGIGIAALRTGIQYNTLQQTTRAALETLLGSAEAANAQMDRLDEFARTSPFAKSVFIEAQQQLLGFGTEAERVVPILDAIQNAVAATGGSNEDIAELTRIIAQLEGGVQLSAETLNQFGTRGIDAAALIGDAMGKTGEQIRSEITAGTLDADVAIQALTDGMQERFAGAADGVKDTFDGAVDRVKAAWRDLSAAIAEPLVDPDGGGALIDFLNTVADVMREFEDLPDPVRNTILAIGGLTGVLLLAGGTAVLAIPKIAEFRIALSTLGITASGTATALSRVGLAATGVGLVASAVFAASDALRATQPPLEAWVSALERGASAADLLQLANEGFLNSIDGAEFDTSNVASYLDQLDRIDESNGWASFLPENWDVQFTDFANRLGNIDDALSQMEPEQAREAFDTLTEGLGLTDAQAEQLLGQMERTSAVIADVEPVAESASAGIDRVAESAEMAARQTEELHEASQALVDGFFNAQDAMSAYEQTIDDISEALNADEDALVPALNDARDAFDLGEQSGRDAASMLQDLVVNAQGATDAMVANGDSAQDVADYQAAARDEIARAAEAMGLSEDAARDYADRLLEIPEGVVTDITANFAGANSQIANWLAQRRIVTVDVVTGSGMPSIAPGGNFAGFADGGRIPGYSPGRDDRLGIDRNGNVFGLGGGEYIMPTRTTDRYLPILEAMRQGTFAGYASGGRLPQYAQSSPSMSAPAVVGGGVTVHQTVQPTQGMSEQAVGNLAASAIAWELRGI